MVKVLASIIFGAILIGLGTLVFGVEVTPVFGSQIWTFVFSALVSSLVGLLELLPFLGLGLIVGGSVYGITDENKGCAIIAGAVAVFVAVVFVHPYIVTNWVVNRVDWFPVFSYWQYFAITLVSTIVSVLTPNGSKKES